MKPILFNTEMVRAILDGRKTQTRRVCKPGTVVAIEHGQPIGGQPFYKGDILYVRETWGIYENQHGVYCYKAGNTAALANKLEKDPSHKWRPSIHMPKEAARIFLRVTDVRVERLHQITEDDAISEGCDRGPSMMRPYTSSFITLWDSTINPSDIERYGWDANPFVWVIEFQRVYRIG